MAFSRESFIQKGFLTDVLIFHATIQKARVKAAAIMLRLTSVVIMEKLPSDATKSQDVNSVGVLDSGNPHLLSASFIASLSMYCYIIGVNSSQWMNVTYPVMEECESLPPFT